MLVLTRKANEEVVFPDQNVVVRVVQIRGGRVRLGIEAPVSIPIIRSEIADRRVTFPHSPVSDHATS